MPFEQINSPIEVRIEASPHEADLAIVSIAVTGVPGQLNEFVLKQYGYNVEDLPSAEQLEHAGFGAIPNIKGKPILFVVTIDGTKPTQKALEDNLYNTLTEFRGWIYGKKVWLPLMGTGAGKLSLSQSYEITARTINRFQRDYPTEAMFLLSIPDIPSGREIYSELINTSSAQAHINNDILESFKCDFYLVGTIWNKEDQLERFIEEKIWEKGFDDESYSSIINSVKPNDILIVKSTYAYSSTSYLRVKAFGVVIENPLNGSLLKIDWRIFGLSVDIENLGFYRDTIRKANADDVKTILDKIDASILQNLIPKISISSPNRNLIPGLISDSEKGIDYLSITKDVTAFARVMAAKSFDPPLAVALFGKWGSGKSFFMRKLREEITSLSIRNPYQAYCEGIAHIHFNAWSYMDANLWASIVTKIFEGLNEYISENSISNEEKKNIERQLGSKLTVAKDEIAALESKKSSVANQILNLQIRKGFLQDDLNKKIDKIAGKTLWSVIKNVNDEFKAQEKICETLEKNESFEESKKQLKEIVPEKYWNNPKEAYEQVKSKYTFLKEFFKGEKVLWNVGILIVILTIIFLVPLFITSIRQRLQDVNFTIPQTTISVLLVVGAIWKRAEITYKKIQPIVASFWKIKEEFDDKLEKAVSEYEQEEKALILQVEKSKAELVVVDKQIQEAFAVKADLEFRIKNALATEALYTFIEKRAKSDDYQKHLGIISTIRRDFEILNDLFVGHNTETKDIQAAFEFKKKFKKPLERIILYIDDLDRCPEENVVQVLEAVNLLMAFPLFIVIVGVDPRWVKNALVKKHSLQFTGKLNPSDESSSGLEIIEASKYLEKIFQIPFHLKDASVKDVKGMIRSLAQTKTFVSPSNNDINAQRGEADESISNDYKQQPSNNNQSSSAAQQTSDDKDKPEAIIISDKEIPLLEDMGEIIGCNPRAIKRFLNSYRIAKAHEDFTYDIAFEEKELLVIMFLLALPISDYRKLLKSFEEFIEDDKNLDRPLAIYLQQSNTLSPELTMPKHKLNVILSDKKSYSILQQEKAGAFLKHNAFIKRFTFKNM